MVSGYGQCSQGLLVNRHFGTVRKIVLDDVTEQVDRTSSTFLSFGDISNGYSRPEKKFVSPFNQFPVKKFIIRESSFNMTREAGGDEDIETRSLKF